jgi:hypothetical protein
MTEPTAPGAPTEISIEEMVDAIHWTFDRLCDYAPSPNDLVRKLQAAVASLRELAACQQRITRGVAFNLSVKFELGDLTGMPVEVVEALFAGIAKVIVVKNEVEESVREQLEQARASALAAAQSQEPAPPDVEVG